MTLAQSVAFVMERWDDLWYRTGQHLVLTGASTLLGLAVGLPLGILAAKVRPVKGAVLACIGVFQTVPSLALLAFLLALMGEIGAAPALVALTLYALLPIVRNTVTGIEGLPPGVQEAAVGIGMSPGQRLWMVELPLATPVILAGLRTSVVAGVGVATLAAFIGAGGLGQFIYRGLSLSNNPLILLGAAPTALLALMADAVLGGLELEVGRRTGKVPLRQAPWKVGLRRVGLLAATLFVLACLGSWARRELGGRGGQVVRVGSMNFTEQILLGELMAQRIEAATDLEVERVLNMGATMIAHNALVQGAIDMYPEYTGTALMAILHQPLMSDPAAVFETIDGIYRRDMGCEWLPPFGFENTYVISVKEAVGARNGWTRISDLVPAAPSLRAGFVAEFMERDDGWPGLRDAYGLRFRDIRDIDTNLMYRAIGADEVDVICNYSTDGRILVYQLRALADDRRYFPPYHAAPVVRQDAFERYPALRPALEPLAGLIDGPTMQRLNYLVDQEKQDPRRVVGDFLREKGLAGS